VQETTTFLLVPLPNIHRFKQLLKADSAKTFLNLIIDNLPHLKYVLVATLPIVDCLFSDINISQCSLATRARCGRILNKHYTANLLGNLPVKEF